MAVWAVSIDAILAALARRAAVRTFRVAAAMVILALSIPRGWAEIQVRQTNVDLVASRLAESVKAGDLIVVSPWYYGVAFQRYYRGQAPWMTVPPIEDLKIHRYDLLKEKMKSSDPIRTLLARMSETLRSGNNLWLVGGWPARPKGSVARALAACARSAIRLEQLRVRLELGRTGRAPRSSPGGPGRSDRHIVGCTRESI